MNTTNQTNTVNTTTSLTAFQPISAYNNTVINTSNITSSVNLAKSYAWNANQKFANSHSNYLSLGDLINTFTTNNIPLAIANAMKTFGSMHSYQKWDDLLLCKAYPLTLDNILIDTTLQRQLDIGHLCRIINNFDHNAVMPVNVYCNDAMPGKYIAFDGMHTSSALFLIAKYLGLSNDLDRCVVPGAIYSSKEKPVIRRNFIYMSTDSKKPMDAIDIFQQMVYGVRTDGSIIPEWVNAEKKQQILEKYNMFATHSKFGDQNQPGALHTMTEFLNDTYSLRTIENFCEYFNAVCGASRAVDTKESWLLFDLFHSCGRSNITVDSQYIQIVADTLNNVMGGTFDSIKFMNRATSAYDEWFRQVVSTTGTLQGISRSEKKIGLVYLNAVLAKHTSLQLPLPSVSWTPFPQYII